MVTVAAARAAPHDEGAGHVRRARPRARLERAAESSADMGLKFPGSMDDPIWRFSRGGGGGIVIDSAKQAPATHASTGPAEGVSAAWLLRVSTRAWEAVACSGDKLPAGRSGHSLTEVTPHNYLLYGGFTASQTMGDVHHVFLDSTWL